MDFSRPASGGYGFLDPEVIPADCLLAAAVAVCEAAADAVQRRPDDLLENVPLEVRLRGAGVEIARVLDARKGENVVRGVGRGKLSGVEAGDGSTTSADLLVTATGWTAPTSLLNMAGDRPVWNPQAARFTPGGVTTTRVMATGGIVGDGSTAELIAHGRAVGAEAAARARGEAAKDVAALVPDAHPGIFQSTTVGFIDYSEDVKSKDIVAAAKEGYDSSELAKRFTT